MTNINGLAPKPEGVVSLLDTDLYKLTMQCAVLKYYKNILVTYHFTNRTPEKKLSREGFAWLEEQILKLGNLSITPDELLFLREKCPYLTPEYLEFLRGFRLRPQDQVKLVFTPDPDPDASSPTDVGAVSIDISGSWPDTILYEIPVLALTSEAFFRFVDTDWSYDGQKERAFDKGMRLFEAGCTTIEFGSRRRRDFHTQELVVAGLVEADKQAEAGGLPGRLIGTSNVLLSMRIGKAPAGTVAHEWFMGVAAITDNYPEATELALRYWVGCFGKQLNVALTDTFGTPEFLRSFSQPVRVMDDAPISDAEVAGQTYAQFFKGLRQDSGNPATYVKLVREYLEREGLKDRKTIVFSDALDVDKCVQYRKVALDAGLDASFGVGTYLTNDFERLSNGSKSPPLNIVIKLNSAAGRPAVKISDNIGKNTGDKSTVAKVKEQLGYVERKWEAGDESIRWGK